MKRFLLTILLLAALLFSAACEEEPVSATALLMDTVCTVTLHDPAEQALAEEALALAAEYEAMLSATVVGSDIYAVNESGGSPVSVSPETGEMLALSLEYAALTEGAFDVTVGSVSRLWDFGGGKHLPDEESLALALSHVDPENLILSGDTVALADPDTRLEPGAVAKGYIARLVRDDLLEQGLSVGVLDFGGTIVTLGEKKDGTPWRIGIQKPFAPQGEIMGIVSLKEGSMVTSGVYQRYFEENGIRYHHILDPETGYPAETELLSVTVVGEDPAVGDILSTACLIMGEEKGSRLLEETAGVKGAVWVYEDRISITGDVKFEEMR